MAMATQSHVLCAMLCSTVSLLLLSLAQLSSGHQYIIKGKPVDSYVEAMDHLQPFLSPRRFDQKQKCQRIAVVLGEFKNSKRDFNQFDVADIALLDKVEAAKRYGQIKVHNSRQRHIEAINDHLEKKQVGPSMIDLVECLRSPPFDRDAVATSFVNSERLRTIVEQYKSIVEQPIKMLTAADGQHPELQLDQLDDVIKATVTNWLGGDEKRLAQIFPNEWFRSITEGQAKIFEGALVQTLQEVYEMLPETTELPDRCQTYRAVLAAEEKDISRTEYPHELIQSIQQDFTDEKNEIVPHPILDAEVTAEDRENFWWILHFLDFIDADLEVWNELDDCAAGWLPKGPEFEVYLSDERRHELKEKFEEMQANEDYEGAWDQEHAFAGPHGAPVQYQPPAPAPVYLAPSPAGAPAQDQAGATPRVPSGVPPQGQVEVSPRAPSRIPVQGQAEAPARRPARDQPQARGNAPNKEQ